MWMSVSSAQLWHIENFTIVRTDAGLSKRFELKVGIHQGSVLSPLLFTVVMDVVPGEAEVVYLQS